MNNNKGFKNFIEKFSNKELLKTIVSSSILGKISGKIVNYRVQNDLKQSDLASVLGVSQAMISKIESGDYNFTIKQLVNICESLDWSIEINMEDKEATNTINLHPSAFNVDSCNISSDNTKNLRVLVA